MTCIRYAALALCLAIVLGTSGCARFFFFPDRELRMTPDQIGLVYSDVWFAAEDGVQLHGWWLAAATGAPTPAPTIVFLHGNAQNVSAHIGSVYWLPAAGFNVFLFDYRGYGTSEGKPTIEAVHRDAEAALRHAATLSGVDRNQIVVFGQSLGGAIAPTAVTEVAPQVSVRALVIDSAFSDFRGIAREKLDRFWLTWPLQAPLAGTVPDRLGPLRTLPDLKGTPILIVHGEADSIIPVEHARRLYEAAGDGAELWIVPGADHIMSFNDPAMRERLVGFLRAAVQDCTSSADRGTVANRAGVRR